MRIFLTGGTGFIGRYTLNELKKRGHQTLVLSRKAQKEKGIEFIKGGLRDVSKWKAKLEKFKPKSAIHLAWEGIPDFSYAQSVKNLEGGLAVLEALTESGCKRIVVAGTGFDCGSRVGKIPDDLKFVPSSVFVAAKHSLHLMGEALAKEKGTDFIWLRPFNPYGYGQRAGSVIPYIMRCVSEGTPLRLRNPLAQGDFIYIEDVARVFVDAATKGKSWKTYNVGSGYLTPIRDIAKAVCEEMGAGKEYYEDFARTAKGKLLNAAYADLKKVKKELGWQPRVAIKEGIKKTVSNYENNNNRF